jgi:hypothetical protein
LPEGGFGITTLWRNCQGKQRRHKTSFGDSKKNPTLNFLFILLRNNLLISNFPELIKSK